MVALVFGLLGLSKSKVFMYFNVYFNLSKSNMISTSMHEKHILAHAYTPFFCLCGFIALGLQK